MRTRLDLKYERNKVYFLYHEFVRENDTWTGEWKTARYDTNMEYKYVVYSGAQQDRAADLEYEWLGKDSRNGVIINRCINLSSRWILQW